MIFTIEKERLAVRRGTELLWIEAWGKDSLRVRATRRAGMTGRDWALMEPVEPCAPVIEVREIDATEPWYRDRLERHRTAQVARIANGSIAAEVDEEGWITFRNARGDVLTREYWRQRNRIDRYCAPLRVDGRELRPIQGTDDYALTARFEAFDDERIFGMGQYQVAHLDKKGAVLELAHRNSQASVPFYVSSRGYGFLWNNPAVGRCSFGTNLTEWTGESCKELDYWITAGETPAAIEARYSSVTGRVPMMPEYGMGYWQCKLRYRTQDEVLAVAREHVRRGYPLDVIVVDFFHWTLEGDFRFDPRCFPDPSAMVRELKDMGVETVVSVWPTVDRRSENFAAMAERGLLVRNDRGMGNHMSWIGDTTFFDATNPEAREFVWETCKRNYYDAHGVRVFWLDEAEPEYGPYEFDLYRYHDGPALQVSNEYPKCYAQGFYEGLRAAGETDVMSLVRCAWAGSQRYGVLTWSGDISSTWRAFREQLQAGLSMGMAGIPWWTSDIGGFLGGMPEDPDFRELLVRWFQWACFCPVFRMHGERQPWYDHDAEHPEYVDNVMQITSGQPNELWSFGEDIEAILAKYLFLRERLRPYIRNVMREAHETGAPVMRPLFFVFPEDIDAWNVEDAYLFGPDVLVAPVMTPGAQEREVYLPAGAEWIEAATGRWYAGGQKVLAQAPLAVIPLFTRDPALAEVLKIN
ncbi:MAG: glycoside hydrolase family 31 protein [Clostridia bacterium]|nr:glycoside hydrolase family 31 protein [Clostridia bacterium]